MNAVIPSCIKADVDEVFCYREDASYQTRAHEYLERYEVDRGFKDTAVQAVVTDMVSRAYIAGLEDAEESSAYAWGSAIGDDRMIEIEAELMEVAAKCLRAAAVMERSR